MKLEHTLYDILEVSQRASSTVVKAAYRSLAQSLHPDKNFGTEASGERLAEINDAYSILSDPVKRMNYDRTLGVKKSMVERRGVETTAGGWELGHFSAGHNVSRPFGFRPLS